MNTMKHIREDIFALSQTEFAEALGIDQSTISRWEAKVKPSSPRLEHVTKVLALAKSRRVKLSQAKMFEMLSGNSAPTKVAS